MIRLIKNIKVSFCVLFLVIGVFFAGEARANVTGVTLGIDLGTEFPPVSGNYYYKSGNPYTFTIDVTTGDDDWTTITDVRLTIEGDTNIIISVNPSGTGALPIGPLPAAVSTGGTATYAISGVNHNNFRVTFVYSPDNTIDESDLLPRNIVASATSAFVPANTLTDTVGHTYGIVDVGIDVGGVVVNNGLTSQGTQYPAASGFYYYKTNTAYNFVVDVTADGHGVECVEVVTFTIPGAAPITFSVDPSVPGVVTVGGDAAGSATFAVSNVVGASFRGTFTYTPTAAVTETAHTAATFQLSGSAKSVFDAAAVPSAVLARDYGIVDVGINVGGVVVNNGLTSQGTQYPAASGFYYYKTNTPYDFVVDVTADGHGVECVEVVTFTIPGAAPITFSVDPSVPGVVTVGGDAAGSATFAVSNVVGASFRGTFTYTPTAAVTETAHTAATFQLSGSAKSVFDAASVSSAGLARDYGIVDVGVNSVDLFALGARTNLSTLDDYYLPNRSYTFTVDVTADGHDWDCVTDVRVAIPTDGLAVILSTNPDAPGGTPAVIVSGGDPSGMATSSIGVLDTHNNFTITFTYTPSWDIDEKTVGAANITASAQTVFDGAAIDDLTPTNITYGISSTVKVILSQGGEAVDGLVNPWHGSFSITGGIVYNVVGATLADLVSPDTDITAIGTLRYSHNIGPAGDTAIANTGAGAALQYLITPDLLAGTGIVNDGIGVFTWVVPVEIDSGGSVDCVSNLTLTCDKIEIIGMEFQNGGGYSGNAPVYNRNIYTSGTQVRVRARMQYGGGNTTADAAISLGYDYDDDALYDAISEITNNINLSAGQEWSDWKEIKNPKNGDDWGSGPLDPGETIAFNSYRIINITGAGGHFGGVGQDDEVKIKQDAYIAPFTNPTILWDNADPPGRNPPVNPDPVQFTAYGATTSAVDTITLNWTRLAIDMASAGADADFYSYRIYYRPTGTPVWNMIDRNTPGAATLGNIAEQTFIITDLQSIVEYEYYLTAVDIFGNETLEANRAHAGTAGDASDTVTTAAYALTINISDGITLYEPPVFPSIFIPAEADKRLLSDSAIRVEIEITGASQPGEINIILADNLSPIEFDADNDGVFDHHPDNGNTVPATWDTPAAPDGFFRITTSKVAPKNWVGHISSNNPLITTGSECKFILEVIEGSTPSYYGQDPDGDMDGTRWTFSIIAPPKVTPWPTRILNNVITSKNDVAYPAYYLTDDAYVTITAYDIKGRVVATLLDNGYRKSGQNIREQGWRGTNKAGRKLGIGLYYIHIKAKRVSDGKTIINKFEKVVMAR